MRQRNLKTHTNTESKFKLKQLLYNIYTLWRTIRIMVSYILYNNILFIGIKEIYEKY